jgi:predicted MPP superfamily phosphohydrolase
MGRFFIALYGLTALCHIPFAMGLGFALRRGGVPAAPVIAIGAAAVMVALLRGRIGRARYDRPMAAWRLFLVEEPYYIHWGATIASVPLTLVILAGSLIAGIASSGDGVRLAWSPGASALAAYLASFALAAWGVLVRRRWVRVRTLDVTIPDLPPSFEGYRIAQLSDLHIGSLCPRERGDRWVQRVNALDVDLVALTGDYVTNGVAFHSDIAAVITALRGKDGVVAVMGNHDYFGDGEPLISLLRRGGVTVLRNEWKTIERGDGRVTLAGVDDTWTRRADVARSMKGRDPALPVIALAHDPALFPKLARAGASLVLSGHTHWGQIAAPFMATRINLSRLSFRYHSGMYREGGSTLYINPGLGTTGPPIRLGSPPEITILRLRREPS